MNEPGLPSREAMIESGPSALLIGAGSLLRAAREAQGLHIAMLAVSLKVPVKKLEALESDRYDLLPDTVFVRALASSVCRALKIDAGPVLAALPRSEVPKIRTDGSGLNATFNDPVSNAGSTLQSQLSKPLGIVVLLLLAGIFAIAFFPSKPKDDPAAFSPADQSPVIIPGPTGASDPENRSAQVPQTPSSVVALTLSESINATGSADSASLAQAPGSSSSAVAMSATAPAAMGSEGILALLAHGSSWVEVLDAQGVVQLRRTLVKDEIVTVSGVLPLTVVVGRADAVAVQIRGQAFDAVAIAKSNVARFEVK